MTTEYIGSPPQLDPGKWVEGLNTTFRRGDVSVGAGYFVIRWSSIAELEDILTDMGNLQVRSLGVVKISPPAAHSFCLDHLFSTLSIPQLRRLYLSNSVPFPPLSVLDLADYLRHSGSFGLEEIALDISRLSIADIAALAEALEFNPASTLRRIDLLDGTALSAEFYSLQDSGGCVPTSRWELEGHYDARGMLYNRIESILARNAVANGRALSAAKHSLVLARIVLRGRPAGLSAARGYLLRGDREVLLSKKGKASKEVVPWGAEEKAAVRKRKVSRWFSMGKFSPPSESASLHKHHDSTSTSSGSSSQSPFTDSPVSRSRTLSSSSSSTGHGHLGLSLTPMPDLPGALTHFPILRLPLRVRLEILKHASGDAGALTADQFTRLFRHAEDALALKVLIDEVRARTYAGQSWSEAMGEWLANGKFYYEPGGGV
ncbi:hypothetical protein Q8F55_005833 [Vanrija albida]|uniref:Uncharacterized protein n=1 Tax=Vanrija albida TaxID=181172 RepID=A0ABR3Q2R4_9TREE